jgi:hypothetical protein
MTAEMATTRVVFAQVRVKLLPLPLLVLLLLALDVMLKA